MLIPGAIIYLRKYLCIFTVFHIFLCVKAFTVLFGFFLFADFDIFFREKKKGNANIYIAFIARTNMMLGHHISEHCKNYAQE